MKLKKVRIDVTEEDIADGVRYLTGECAIALAIRRATFARFVDVQHDGIWVDGKFSRPRGLKAFVEAFDRGEAVAPTTFEIAV